MTDAFLDEQDISAWAQKTASLLKRGRFGEIDVEHLVEELESMGRRDRQELVSRLKILLAPLLKWQYQPTHGSSAWRGSILEQRLRIRELLSDVPSLKPFLDQAIDQAYPDGKTLAAKETGLSATQFPIKQPYRLDALREDDWWPDQIEPRLATDG